MIEEYRMRAELLIKRLDVTMQSFSWSERTKVRACRSCVERMSNVTASPRAHFVDVRAVARLAPSTLLRANIGHPGRAPWCVA